MLINLESIEEKFILGCIQKVCGWGGERQSDTETERDRERNGLRGEGRRERVNIVLPPLSFSLGDKRKTIYKLSERPPQVYDVQFFQVLVQIYNTSVFFF